MHLEHVFSVEMNIEYLKLGLTRIDDILPMLLANLHDCTLIHELVVQTGTTGFTMNNVTLSDVYSSLTDEDNPDSGLYGHVVFKFSDAR